MAIAGDDEPTDYGSDLFRKLLNDPARWRTEAEFYAHEPARSRKTIAGLGDCDWLELDEKRRFRLSEAGTGALTRLVQTGGRERCVLRTFLWEGGSAARQMYRSHHGRRHSFIETAQDELGDLSATDFDATRVRGFWWTLPRYGLAAARPARLERRQYRRRLPPPVNPPWR
ncbi:MAG TPA: hypothetical protein VFN97_27660 [Actinospica sp.]|nr:hypothetical protein [Actinospica sp.]